MDTRLRTNKTMSERKLAKSEKVNPEDNITRKLTILLQVYLEEAQGTPDELEYAVVLEVNSKRHQDCSAQENQWPEPMDSGWNTLLKQTNYILTVPLIPWRSGPQKSRGSSYCIRRALRRFKCPYSQNQRSFPYLRGSLGFHGKAAQKRLREKKQRKAKNAVCGV